MDLFGNVLEVITAPFDGVIYSVYDLLPINAGDMDFMVASFEGELFYTGGGRGAVKLRTGRWPTTLTIEPTRGDTSRPMKSLAVTFQRGLSKQFRLIPQKTLK
jgi:hypothetical protein